MQKERLVCLMCICAFFATAQGLSAEIKDRYIYFSIGTANVSYPDEKEVDQAINLLNDLSDSRGSFPIPFDVDLGAYYSLSNQRTMIGAAVNGELEDYKVSEFTLISVFFTPALSAMHFLSREIGRGLFLRADIGPVWRIWDTSGGSIRRSGSAAEIEVSTGVGLGGVKATGEASAGLDEEVNIGFGENAQGDMGIGFLVGGGFAFPVRSRSILLNANYAARLIDGQTYGTLSVSVGGFVY